MPGATSSLQDRYGQIYRYLRRRVASDERAQELTQEVFASAAAALNGAEGEYPLALLYTIARRRFADEVRRSKRTARAALTLTGAEHAAEPSAYGPNIARALRDAMLRLAPEHRAIVRWKLFEGRPFSEISAKEGLSEAACRMRLTRALRVLRDELEKEGIER